MKQRKVYSAGNGRHDCGYANWMQATGFVSKIEEADFVIGLGGSDVGCKYYNQPDSGLLGSNEYCDSKEYPDFTKAIKLGKPIVGICKGAQWGAALAGGAIFQDVRHPWHHKITTHDGKKLIVNSLHHNLQDVSNLKENEDYKLLAWAENLSPHHLNGWRQDMECEKEPEIVFYPKIKLLGYQFHPEMMFRNENKDYNETIAYCRDLLNKFLDDKL